MTKYYRKIADSLARAQRVSSNADMFESRGDTWQPTQRELDQEPRTVALRKRLLTPDEYAKAYGPLNPSLEPVRVDKHKLNEEKRNRARFHRKQHGVIGHSRDPAKVRKALARGKVVRSSDTLAQVVSPDFSTAKTSKGWEDYGHFVLDKRQGHKTRAQEKQEATEKMLKWL